MKVLPMEVTIRRLAPRDYTAVKMIEKNMLEEYRRELEKTGGRDETLPSIEQGYFKEYVSREGSFVADAEGMIVGFIFGKAVPFMHGEEKIVWLEQIAVLGGFRKEGVGSRLLVAVEDWARKKKIKILYTTLNPNNVASRRLLTSRGFEVRDWQKATKMLSR